MFRLILHLVYQLMRCVLLLSTLTQSREGHLEPPRWHTPCTSAPAPAPAPWQRCQIIACVADEAELRVNFNPIVCSQKSAAHKCKQPTHTHIHTLSHTLPHTHVYVYLFLRTAFPAECI